MVLLVLLAIVVSSVGWGLVWLLDWPWWIGALITFAAALLVTAVALAGRIKAAINAKRLERELLKQAAAQAEAAQPERRAEVLELVAQMKQSIATLKRSKLRARGGGGALYALPWYVIVGPPASGKTTAIERSGLTFVTPPGAKSSKLKGTAGTRNCDWWFTNKAILLDTAGRFVTDDADQAEWFAFLDILKRHRRTRPLDGIIAAVSLADLAGADGARVEALAAQLRTRVEELLAQLDMILPVYLVFTKTDLVSGFVEFWSDLSKPQRGQVWGASFALDDPRLGEPEQAFEEEFEALAQRLHARMLERLPREQLTANRARVLQFPAEFQALRQPLSQLVGELFRASPYQDAPLFRGFYFTSGTQVGRPFARVLANMIASFGLLGPPAQAPAGADEARSFFVTELLESVVFPDRDIAIRSSHWLARGARLRLLGIGAAATLALALIVPALLSYFDNSDLIDETRARVDAIAKESRASEIGPATAQLEPLLALVQRLERARQEFSIPGWIGLHAAGDLHDPVHALYVERLRAVLEGPVRTRLAADVRTIADIENMSCENFTEAYDDLRLYVALTTPKWLGERENGAECDASEAQLAAKWAKALRSGADAKMLCVHARHYLSALRANPSWAWPADAVSLRAARSRLARAPVDECEYERFLSHAKGVEPITVKDVFKSSALPYRERASSERESPEIPGAYTSAGWNQLKAHLDADHSQLLIEPWVLDEAQAAKAEPESPALRTQRLQNKYFASYLQSWRNFIGSLRVKTPSDIISATEELRALADATNGPYVLLFNLIAANAKLDMNMPLSAERAADSLKEAVKKKKDDLLQRSPGDAGASQPAISEVERRMAPLVSFGAGDNAPLKAYLSELRKLEVQLRQIMDSTAAPNDAFRRDLLQTSMVVERLVEDHLDGEAKVLLRPLLLNPIVGSRVTVTQALSSALSDKWKGEVYDVFEAKLANRYPFASSNDDLALVEFADFFRPGSGTLWSFVEQNLGTQLERRGSDYVPRAGSDPSSFRPDFLACLRHSLKITDAIFGTKPEPSVPFRLLAEASDPSAEVLVTVDGGKPISFRRDAQWVPMTWPGPGTARGVSVQLKGPNFSDTALYRGDFGLFRLLATSSGGRTREGDTLLSTNVEARPGQVVKVSVQPTRSVHPFSRGFFSWRCPPAIAAVPAGGSP